ncbi:MAG: TonB-dependent receptor [Burkholderiales bacterium]
MRFAIFALLAALAPPVLAQSNDAVVINATRFPEDARRLPASVTVLEATDIGESAARTLPELLFEQTGINMRDFFGNNAAGTAIDLRGFGITGTQNALVLVDGRRISDFDLSGVQWAAIPLASIERIEILRGTGAVLYGDGATAGVVNIITRSPLKQGPRAEARGRIASYGTTEGQLYGSRAGESFGINASIFGFDADGYRRNNRNQQENLALNMRWGIGESYADLRFGTDRQKLRLPGARSVQPSIGLNEYVTDPRGAQTPLDWSERDGDRVGATFAHRIGDVELTLGLDWRDKAQRSYFDQQGPVARDDRLQWGSISPRARVPVQIASVEHRFTLGFDSNAWRYDSRRADRPENLPQPVNRVRVNQDALALYAQDAVQVSAKSLLTLGWRDERVQYRATDAFDPAAPGFPGFGSEAPAASERQRQHAWEAGWRQELSPAWAWFARAGRSYRFVNAEEIYESDAAFNAQFQILRPQHARTVEGGAEWRVRSASVRATLFHADITDEIHLDPFSAGIGNTNLPPTRRRGIETQASWQATTGVRLSAGYAYTDARFRGGVLPGNAFFGTNVEIAGKRVPLVPAHKLNLGLDWDLGARTRLSGALTVVSAQFMDNDEPNTLGAKIPAYAVLDVKLAREFGWGRFALALNNALDEQYYTYAVRSNFTPDKYNVYPLPGRTLSLTAEFRVD